MIKQPPMTSIAKTAKILTVTIEKLESMHELKIEILLGHRKHNIRKQTRRQNDFKKL